MDHNLPESEKKRLLDTAREAITAKTAGTDIKDRPESIPPSFLEKRGVFVSLHKQGRLRGCIGYVKPHKKLYEGVVSAALSAAFEDPRFPPVTGKELDQLQIEISVLTPPSPVGSWKDIKLGTHGVVLKKGGLQALFLPQVAVEQKWDLPTTLTHLSLKAGLGPDDWREGASFEVFEALVFGEEGGHG